MRRMTFYINFDGLGDNVQEAWEDGLETLLNGINGREWDKPPGDIFGEGEEVPCAEILGGNLDGGFCIDHGEDSDSDVALQPWEEEILSSMTATTARFLLEHQAGVEDNLTGLGIDKLLPRVRQAVRDGHIHFQRRGGWTEG